MGKKTVRGIASACRWKIQFMKEAFTALGDDHKGDDHKIEDMDSFFFGLETICAEMVDQLLVIENLTEDITVE